MRSIISEGRQLPGSSTTIVFSLFTLDQTFSKIALISMRLEEPLDYVVIDNLLHPFRRLSRDIQLLKRLHDLRLETSNIRQC